MDAGAGVAAGRGYIGEPRVFPYTRVLDELAACQRFFEKSYPPPIAPGAVHGATPILRATGGSFMLPVQMKVSKRAVPTCSVYNPQSGALGSMRNYDDSADVSGQATHATTEGFNIGNTGVISTPQARIGVHWTADAEIPLT